MPAAEQIRETDLASDLALLVDAAREAGQIALRYFKRSPEVWMKGGMSPVSEADLAADRFLRETLLAARPDYGWLSEETADDPARLKARRTFIVDPIDGTRGFLEGRSEWCVSVAVVETGRPLAGVLECPARRETFTAVSGGGALKDGARLVLSPTPQSLILGGPGSMINALPADLRSRVKRGEYVPSLAYRLAMVADGRLAATFVKSNSRDWDLAAADLILHEAGGSVLDDAGLPPSYGEADTAHGSMAAGRGELLLAMARSLRSGR